MSTENAILTVSQLTVSLKTLLEGAYPFVWVRGQVTNCSRPSSGHLYFSLKDENASLAAVWFRGQQRTAETFDPLTGEVFEDGPRQGLAGRLENGMEVICAGRLTVYPPRGTYQLVVELAQEAGLGKLQLEFERLKVELAARGFFKQERKRRLPHHPARVAVITAATGAAIHDFLRMAHERGCGSEIRILPVPVQGDEAPEKIAAALERVCAEGWAEVAVLIRGGGSLEDLWAFNTECVAKAVFASTIPVLAGIGHEVDHSIADMTADMRAATPTHAAQLLWVERRELAQRIDELETTLIRAGERFFALQGEALAGLSRALAWLSPDHLLERWEERLHGLKTRLASAREAGLRDALTALDRLENRLAFPLERSLSAAERDLERLGLRLGAAGPVKRLASLADHLETMAPRLEKAWENELGKRETALEKLELRLEALNPMQPIQRGYALVRKTSGRLLRSAAEAIPGERLELVLHDGKVTTRVEKE